MVGMPVFLCGSICSAKRCLVIHNFHLYQIQRFVSENHYEILKLPQSCTQKEIRDAFINLSKQNHPDKHLNDPSMHNRFIRINEAYSVLQNPSSRRSYDITLQCKQKLNPPRTQQHYQPQYQTQHQTQYQTQQQSARRNASYSSGFTEDPFVHMHSRNMKNATKGYYGFEGIKKVSNAMLLLVLLGVTVCGVALQLLVIRKSFLRGHEKMLEQSRKCSMYHAMARERARLYGTSHHLKILKNSLKTTYPVKEDGELLEPDVVTDLPTEKTEPICEKCNKRMQN